MRGARDSTCACRGARLCLCPSQMLHCARMWASTLAAARRCCRSEGSAPAGPAAPVKSSKHAKGSKRGPPVRRGSSRDLQQAAALPSSAPQLPLAPLPPTVCAMPGLSGWAQQPQQPQLPQQWQQQMDAAMPLPGLEGLSAQAEQAEQEAAAAFLCPADVELLMSSEQPPAAQPLQDAAEPAQALDAALFDGGMDADSWDHLLYN